MYTPIIQLPEHSARVDAHGIFQSGVSSLNPDDYTLISQNLRNWFFSNTTGHRLDMPHLGFETGYMSAGISCKYIPAYSGGPALRFFAHDEDAMYTVLKDMSRSLFPRIRRQINKAHGKEMRNPDPILPGLESYLPDVVEEIKAYEKDHPPNKSNSGKLERFVVNTTYRF